MGNYDRAKQEYLRTKVLTATPEQLHLMLIDGAIRFTEEARTALDENRLDAAHEASVRAQNIILELSSSLNHDIDPDLCGRLASLYNFIYRKLIEGNMNRNTTAFDEALRILTYQRETWVMLMDKLAHSDQEETELPDPDDSDADQPVGHQPLSISASRTKRYDYPSGSNHSKNYAAAVEESFLRVRATEDCSSS